MEPKEDDPKKTDNETAEETEKEESPKVEETLEKQQEREAEEAKIREQWIKTLKNQQSAATSAVTKKSNEIARLMVNSENLHFVKSELESYNDLVLHYHDCYGNFFEELSADEQEKESQRHNTKSMTILGFQTHVNEWIKQTEQVLLDELDTKSDKSHVSVKSKAFSDRSLRSNRSSQVRERARLAELLVQKSMLEKAQKLKAEQEQLELETEIERAKARQNVFAQDMYADNTDTPNVPLTKNVKTEHLDPTAPEFKPQQHQVPPSEQKQSKTQHNANHGGHGKIPQQSALHAPVDQHQQSITMQNDVIMKSQQQIASALFLPQPQVEKFSGDPIDFISFRMAFDSRIIPHTTSDSNRLYYLHQHVEGSPKNLISGCLFMDETQGYMTARSLLQKEYGDPYKIASAYMNKIQNWPNLKNDDSQELKNLSLFLTKCQHAMNGISHLAVLNHSPNMQMIIKKLPGYLQNRWRDYVMKVRISRKGGEAMFDDIVNFVKFASDVANDPIYSREAMGQKASDHNKGKEKRFIQKTSFATDTNTVPAGKDPGKVACPLCSRTHDLEDCEDFIKKTVEERRKFIMGKRLCFSCFLDNHQSKDCKNKRKCKECGKPHPTTMHETNFKPRVSKRLDSKTEHQGNDSTASEDTVSSSTIGITDTVLQAILPVKVQLKGRTVKTYAFYDNGSTGCFITEELKEQLNAGSKDTVIKLQTMHGVDYVNTSVVHDIIVYDCNDEHPIVIPKVYTRNEIPVSNSQIPRPELLRKWPHLKEVASKVPPYDPSLTVGLLIGSNCPLALQPLKVIPTQGKGPFATMYRHGWTVNGPLHVKVQSNGVVCNRIMFTDVNSVTECVTPMYVNKMFELDFSERDKGCIPGARGPSVEDSKFIEMTEKNVKTVGVHYEIPLPFREPPMSIPNNRSQAVSRAEWQRRKMLKNQKYHSDYVAFVGKLINKGYAHEVPKEELESKQPVWYLPHHGIYHPQKPEKIRVVFDCSAKYRGISLNDTLLQGPDLTNSLVGVLTRFREETVALMGDIESMFYQVKVPSYQQDFLRFLWWPNGNLDDEIKEYRMEVHTFGAISSPSIANFALRETAKKAERRYGKLVSDVINRNFYVDDCLKSVKDELTAKQLIHDLTAATAESGFKLTKFTSNSKDVLKSIPQDDCSKEVQACNLDYDNLHTERALGMKWHIRTDCFGYSTAIKEKKRTRRGLLSMIASLYDPLGLVSPFILPAKRILQQICQAKDLGWDDNIPDDCIQRWEKWLDELPLLESLTIPRCIKPNDFGEVKERQLHVFSDASSTGYGVAAYIRLYDGERYHTVLMLGKSRVAPVKPTTIPRLELTAATVSVQVAQHLLNELDISIDNVTYHTDSTTVLHYIRSEKRRFPIFVANRVRLIRDFSEPTQWRYVRTNENPADPASRGLDGQQLLNSDLWFKGPEFLRKDDSTWEADPTKNMECHYEEETSTVAATQVNSSSDTVHRLLDHYSSWYRLKRAVAIYKRLFKFLKTKQNPQINETLSVLELNEAEDAILRFIQKEAFPEEVTSLKGLEGQRGRVLKKSSSICKLDPFMERDSKLLKVGGRLERANMSEHMRHQILLPHRSHVTTLIIRCVHERLVHAGRNHVLATLREKYWVITANSAVRSVIRHCVTCRKLREPVMQQMMADLPQDRVNPSPPFSHVGIDFFGPHLIKEGRKEVKRYGALFTCLASRAVHIETANSLETDSFINAMRRFISRRGQIKVIRCDNGTNFRGAEKELRDAIQEMDQKRIESYLLQQNIQWKFNPPAASHMGGVWERQIRTVRKVLAPMLKEFGCRLNDESYRTLLCEVECIVNSRPLTTITDSIDDLNPLSPNHLLTTKSSINVPPPGDFQKNDVYLRRRWRQVQYLANVFWSRWKREYLQTLQIRQKWTTPRKNLQVGDIVLLKDENLSRNKWNMARVTEVHPDKGNFVRSVTVKTQNGILQRPIQKLVPLVDSTN